MKEIVLKLYEFDELSKDSQERIIERERWNVMEQCMDAYDIDYKKSMEAFEDLTDTKVYGWEVGYERYDFSYEFKYKDPIYEHPTDYHRDIFPDNLCGKLLFRYINNNIMPYIIKGKYFSTSGKYIDGKYKYRHKYSRVMFDYGDNCPLTGMCYDYYLLKPIIDYYNVWCTYPEDFSLEDLMGQCYDNFFKSWHEEYEHWVDDEDLEDDQPNVWLRIKNGIIETSKNIKIERAEAERLWKLIKLFHNGGKFQHNMALDITGHKWKINSYKNDILVVGCHRIAYSEMKGIARQLGWS